MNFSNSPKFIKSYEILSPLYDVRFPIKLNSYHKIEVNFTKLYLQKIPSQQLYRRNTLKNFWLKHSISHRIYKKVIVIQIWLLIIFSVHVTTNQ
jgi:hypothetical protein